MKKIILTLMALTGLFVVSGAKAEWINLSNGLDELDIHTVAAGSKDPAIIFAGSNKTIYRTVDSGMSWHQVLRLPAGDNHIWSIDVDDADPKIVYVCTDQGIYKSEDSGRKWSLFFVGSSNSTKKVLCVTHEPDHPEILWIGTDRGLFHMNQKTREIQKVNGLPDVAVYSIFLNQPKDARKIITTDRGIYRSTANNNSWEKVFSAQEVSENDQTNKDALQQFGVEEVSVTPLFSNLIFLANQNKFYAATKNGVLQGTDNASTWHSLEGQTLPDKKINFIAPSQKTFYAATDRGIFQWDDISRSFHEIYAGLGSNEIRTLHYNAIGNYLLAATKKGVYRLSNPELTMPAPSNEEISVVQAQTTREILIQFSNEPTVLEIQNATIQYAEVHPRKIEEWRNAAARSAWAPTLSFHQTYSTSDNIDIDRGGTADVDKFIRGPREKSQDRYATVSWNLADLIWNNDQTSIDSRSKLMVELRNDVLNEVTHLYFERRRLQVEMITVPLKDLPVNLEREIRMQELTASIDALTGGYLSKRLSEIQHSASKK